MPENVNVETLREVSIYLNHILNELHEINVRLEQEEQFQKSYKVQRTFVLASAFIAPLVLTFVYNATGIGHP